MNFLKSKKWSIQGWKTLLSAMLLVLLFGCDDDKAKNTTTPPPSPIIQPPIVQPGIPGQPGVPGQPGYYPGTTGGAFQGEIEQLKQHFNCRDGQRLNDVVWGGSDNFFALTIFYTFVGLIIGFFVKTIMSLFVSAGAIMTQQMGFSAIRYFDPSANQQIGPLEKIISWTILIILIKTDALYPMLKGTINSFQSIHMYDWSVFKTTPDFYLRFFKNIFISSIMLASPIIITNFFIMCVLGIISRTVPQMNVLMVSFVVNIGLGLMVFIVSSTEFFSVGLNFYEKFLGEWFLFLK